MRSLLLAALFGFLQAPVPAPPAAAPAVYTALFHTTSGNFAIEVHRDWAPRGADRFYALVKSGYYNGAAVYRMLPGFVAQWGLSPQPAVTAEWDKSPIPDDPVLQSNTLGRVSFAASGPNSRTAQVFVNLGDNARLDKLGFAPFGQVVSGLAVVEHFASDYGEQPNQDQITSQGAAYLTKNFPRLDVIYSASLASPQP